MPLPRFERAQIETSALREAWRRDGAVIIDDFWGAAEVTQARARAEALRETCAAAATTSPGVSSPLGAPTATPGALYVQLEQPIRECCCDAPPASSNAQPRMIIVL